MSKPTLFDPDLTSWIQFMNDVRGMLTMKRVEEYVVYHHPDWWWTWCPHCERNTPTWTGQDICVGCGWRYDRWNPRSPVPSGLFIAEGICRCLSPTCNI